MNGVSTAKRAKSSGLLATLGVVLLVMSAAGVWWWAGNGGTSERKEQNAFCWSLVPGGEPEGGASTADCGDALETAMTGRPPGSPVPEGKPEHDEERVRVFEETVRSYADHVMPAEVRGNMANVLAHYAVDVHGVLVGRESANNTGVAGEELVPFLRGVFEDESGFRTVHDTQIARVDEALGELDHDDFTTVPDGGTDRAMGTVSDGGTVLGTLTQIRRTAIAEQGDEDAATKGKLIDTYEEYGLPRLRSMIQDRAVETGVPEGEVGESGSRSALLLQEAGQAYTAAANRAEGALR